MPPKIVEPENVIYALYDKRDPEKKIRYVGLTSQRPSVRLGWHRGQSKNGKSPLHVWVRSIGVENLTYLILETVPKGSSYLGEMEKYWIQRFRNDGITELLNVAEGGWGGKMPEEVKKKLSIINTGTGNGFYGKRHTEETKRILTESSRKLFSGEDNPFFGKRHSEESKQRMSATHTGVKMSPETLLSMSEAQSGEKNAAAKLNREKVLEIYRLSAEGMVQVEIAPLFGVTQGAVSAVLRGKTWPKVYKEHHSVE